MYLPRMSNSRFTRVPTAMRQKFVCSSVYGMIATRNVPGAESHTVRLTPLTVTEPFSTVI